MQAATLQELIAAQLLSRCAVLPSFRDEDKTRALTPDGFSPVKHYPRVVHSAGGAIDLHKSQSLKTLPPRIGEVRRT